MACFFCFVNRNRTWTNISAAFPFLLLLLLLLFAASLHRAPYRFVSFSFRFLLVSFHSLAFHVGFFNVFFCSISMRGFQDALHLLGFPKIGGSSNSVTKMHWDSSRCPREVLSGSESSGTFWKSLRTVMRCSEPIRGRPTGVCQCSYSPHQIRCASHPRS